MNGQQSKSSILMHFSYGYNTLYPNLRNAKTIIIYRFQKNNKTNNEIELSWNQEVSYLTKIHLTNIYAE